MKNILKYISLLFLGAAAVSCDFEDMPFDKYDSDFVFSNDKKAEGYVLGVYLGLPFDKSDENGYNRVDGAMLASASDEAMITVPGSSIVFLTDGAKNRYRPMVVAVDGSLFRYSTLLRPAVSEELEAFLVQKHQRYCVCKPVPNASAIGTAAASLLQG